MSLFTPASSRSPSEDVRIRTPDFQNAVDASILSAFALFERASTSHELAENAAKDIAHLLHTLGKVREALESIKFNQLPFKIGRFYGMLVSQLKILIDKPVPPISSRVVYVELPPGNGRIHLELLRNLFPNVQKVWRVILSPSGKSCLIEFASHSSARRAVDARQQGAASVLTGPPIYHNVKCAWVSPYVHIPPLSIDYIADLPVIEVATDDSMIAPSMDWRRPRPRAESGSSVKSQEMFSTHDLLSVLKGTGAFDDYPPQACQVRV
jgi:hypothetical protein